MHLFYSRIHISSSPSNLFVYDLDGYIALVEQMRVERAMQGLMSKERENDKVKDRKDLEEERTKTLVEKEKLKYLLHM